MEPFKPDWRQLRILQGYANGETHYTIARAIKQSCFAVEKASIQLRKAMGALTQSHAVALGYEMRILPGGRPPKQMFGIVKEPAVIGRPPAVTDEMLAALHAGISGGESVASMANRFGVSKTTLYKALRAERGAR